MRKKALFIMFEIIDLIKISKETQKMLQRSFGGADIVVARNHVFLNIYFVPNVKNNILSLNQLFRKDYDIGMKDMTIQFVTSIKY